MGLDRSKSLDFFEQTIVKDSSVCPRLMAGLAAAYVALSGFDDRADRADPDRAAQMARMRAAAEKAIRPWTPCWRKRTTRWG